LRRSSYLCLLLALLLVLSACGGGGGETADTPQQTGPAQNAQQSPPEGEAAPGGSYAAPEVSAAAFHAELALGDSGVLFDLSTASEGYVGVSAVADARLKFQVICGEVTYTYDLAWDGTPMFFPLQSGSGSYLLRVTKNVEDNKYAELYAAECQAEISDEFQPYLRANAYVDYAAGDACVRKAAELAAAAADEVGVVAGVYDYICASVSYDTEKASSVTGGYVPDPDEVMSSGKGICFDYASLAAAMLRSQGIPTKLVFGYVSPDEVYHAWNMFYTRKTGWVTVGFPAEGDSWNRLDLTFSANGADSSFIGDGSNYTDVYFY